MSVRERWPARPRVFLAVPHRNDLAAGVVRACFNRGDRHDLHDARFHSTSLLALCFNTLWCMALNERATGITHFAMIHSDIVPVDNGWLDTLLGEMWKADADILSVVAPIKDERGLTSTAVMDRDTGRLRRLTMKEVCHGPATFDAADMGFPGHDLLPNTGLWVCDFTRPWVEDMAFQVRDRIERQPDGTFLPRCFSEDWQFGVDAARKGLRVCCTTKVRLHHVGQFTYPNYAPWGLWDRDQLEEIYWDSTAPKPELEEAIA